MKLEQINKLPTNQLSYIAGFLDGDGSIMVQMVRFTYLTRRFRVLKTLPSAAGSGRSAY